MKRIRLMKWFLEVDLNRTKEHYSKDCELCECLYCENYRDVCRGMEPTIVEIFTALGIDPAMPSHLSEFGEMEDGLRLYIGNYPLVGKLIEGEDCTDSEWNDSNTARIENFTFGFGKDALYGQEEEPYSALHLEVEAQIPWLLNKKPED